MLRVLPPTKKNLAALFVARQFHTSVVKSATSLLHLSCSDDAKQVFRFWNPDFGFRILQSNAKSKTDFIYDKSVLTVNEEIQIRISWISFLWLLRMRQ